MNIWYFKEIPVIGMDIIWYLRLTRANQPKWIL
jgi:hypothetical protein